MAEKGLKFLFNAQTVAASTTATSTNVINTKGLSQLDIYVSNSGTSTSCTIQIKGSPTSDKALERIIATYELGAGVKTGDSIIKGTIPRYTWAVVINGDALNPATATVELDSPDWNST